ncbi:MAG: PD-(D/E)XK nuclease family protein [Dehalococcoidales bacterium]|nr:PD-(D/E)XK nuclease family protein [Dehalococcoidales bacterium]
MQYIDRLKTKDRGYFSFGTSLHSCVEHFFRVKTPPPPSLDEMLAFYERSWLSEGYESPEEEANFKEYGREILSAFWETHSSGFRMPVAVERMFVLDVDGIKIRGFIDHVDKLDSGGLSVIDYKTNRDLFTADYVENDLQLSIYQMAAEQMWNLPVEKLTLYHLRSNTPCSAPARSPERIEDVTNLIHDVADNIVHQVFPATENRFCPCDFPEYCPYYRHLYLTEEPPADSQPPLPDPTAIDAVTTVERYAEIQAQINELKAELEETRLAIVEYCRAESLNRVYGTGHEITFRLMERTGFDEEEVKAVLQPAGLWDMVTKLDETRLKALIADESVDGKLRKQLEALRRVVSSYPQLRVKTRAGDEEEES